MDKESFEIYLQRLDVMCSVAEMQLEPGGRPTKADFRNLYKIAKKVVETYEKEKGKNGRTNL